MHSIIFQAHHCLLLRSLYFIQQSKASAIHSHVPPMFYTVFSTTVITVVIPIDITVDSSNEKDASNTLSTPQSAICSIPPVSCGCAYRIQPSLGIVQPHLAKLHLPGGQNANMRKRKHQEWLAFWMKIQM